MDGSTAAFLFDPPFLSRQADDYAGGILYVEDFDCEPRVREPAAAPVEADTAPALSQADLDRARDEGRIEGMQRALEEAAHTRAQLQEAAFQSVGESLAAARVVLERVATQHAAESARALLAMMVAAIPATMARHGGCEIESLLDALMPGLVCEPELRVRANPELADTVRERLAEQLPSQGIVLSVVADPKLGLGDVEIAWQQGQARRDCTSIWNAIRAAMGAINLPSIEEVCITHGS